MRFTGKEKTIIKDKSIKDKFANKEFAAKILILVGLIILAAIYLPLAREQVRYWFSAKGKNAIVLGKDEAVAQKTGNESKNNITIPIDEDFGIVIPKISANAKIVADVDPNDSRIYQRALTQGVAQARGSALPGENGNVFIFAHSGADLSEAVRYNAVFYLLNELEAGDDIFVFYQNEKYSYRVSDKKIVSADSIEYLKGDEDKKSLTLMTCWPAGTTLKRLIVIGEEL